MNNSWQHDNALRIVSEDGETMEYGLSFGEVMERVTALEFQYYDDNFRYDRKVKTYFSRDPQSKAFRRIESIDAFGRVYRF